MSFLSFTSIDLLICLGFFSLYRLFILNLFLGIAIGMRGPIGVEVP